MKSYSMDLRVRVLSDCDAGLKTKQVAEKYSVSPAWVRRLKQRRRETGRIEPRPHTGGPKPKLKPHHDQLRRLVREHPDATLEELRKMLGVSVSLATICRALKAAGLTFKKSSACIGTGSA